MLQERGLAVLLEWGHKSCSRDGLRRRTADRHWPETAWALGRAEKGLRAGGALEPRKDGVSGKGALVTGQARLKILLMTHHLRCEAAQNDFC